MSLQNAYSWGYADTEHLKWQNDLILNDQFPFKLLPTIGDVNYFELNDININNKYLNQLFDDKSLSHILNIDICVSLMALGDLQCSVYSCLENEHDCGKLKRYSNK
jgi:hypothetical protein